MKKFLMLLALSGFLTQCATNDDTPEEEGKLEKPEDLTISISINGNIIKELQEKILYISNEDGFIEGQLTLLNDQENVLSIPRKPNVRYDLIIYDKSESHIHTRHTFNVYQNIKSSEYNIDANYSPGKTLPKLNLNLINTGYIQQIGNTGGGSSTASSTGGGYFNYEGSFLTNPGNFYTSFKKGGESFGRYFWVENVEEDMSVTLDYEQLPSTTLVPLQLPDHENGTIFIFGLTSTYPGVAHHLSYGFTQGNSAYETYVPNESIFDLFNVNATLSNGNTSYRFVTNSETLPSVINLPSFDLSLNSFSLNNVDFTTTGTYDFSVTTFVSSEEFQEVGIIVNIYSKEDSQISFSNGQLINSILELEPAFESFQLKPSSISLTSLSYRNYADAIKGEIENKGGRREPGYSLETLTRRKE